MAIQLKSFVLDFNVEVDVVLCWSRGFDNLGGIPKVKTKFNWPFAISV